MVIILANGLTSKKNEKLTKESQSHKTNPDHYILFYSLNVFALLATHTLICQEQNIVIKSFTKYIYLSSRLGVPFSKQLFFLICQVHG